MFVCLFVSLCDEDMWEFGALKTACSWQCVPYGHQLAQQSVHLLLRSLEDSSACVCSASLVLIRSCTHPDSKPVSMGWSYPTNLQIRWRCGQIMSLAFKVQDWSFVSSEWLQACCWVIRVGMVARVLTWSCDLLLVKSEAGSSEDEDGGSNEKILCGLRTFLFFQHQYLLWC